MSVITDRKDMYKTAPTWLHNLDGESKLFTDQAAVDTAWENGWYGPQGAFEGKRPLSEIEGDFDTKGKLCDEADSDPRYDGLILNPGRARDEILDRIKRFEIEEGIVQDPSEAQDGDE